MTHKYNTRAKKDSVVTNESLENLEVNIIKNINSVKDKMINLKGKFIKLFQENNDMWQIDKCWRYENKLNTLETSLDSLEQYGRRSNIVIPDILNSVQDSDLESIVTSSLALILN